MGEHGSEGADDIGNHLQIIASAMHLIERSLTQDAALRPLTRCARQSVNRVATLVLRQGDPTRIV